MGGGGGISQTMSSLSSQGKEEEEEGERGHWGALGYTRGLRLEEDDDVSLSIGWKTRLEAHAHATQEALTNALRASLGTRWDVPVCGASTHPPQGLVARKLV